MSLISVRSLIKIGQSVGESLLFSSRSITMTKTMCNTQVGDQAKHVVNETKTASDNKPMETSQQASDTDETRIDQEATPTAEDIEKIMKEITDLNTKNAQLLDKYKRALADGENMRNRLTKQISEARIFGIQSFCKDLLDVADVLGKATETVPKSEVTDSNPHLKILYEGLLMTEQQLKSVFKRHGLETVNPIGEKFDPNFHEALFQQEVNGKETGTVVVVSKIGYKLQDRVIRPALVGVSK